MPHGLGESTDSVRGVRGETAGRLFLVALADASRLVLDGARTCRRGGELRLPLGARPDRAADAHLVSSRGGTAERERRRADPARRWRDGDGLQRLDASPRRHRHRGEATAALGTSTILQLSSTLAAVGNTGFDHLALLCALRAVGATPRPSLVVLAYAASELLALIPLTPGGLGFVEAGLWER